MRKFRSLEVAVVMVVDILLITASIVVLMAAA